MKTNEVTQIDSEEFVDRIILSKEDSLVKFSSPWNGTGRLMCNALHELAPQYRKLNFYSIDYDANWALATTYRVEPVPTLLFFKKGTLVDKLSGLIQKSVITERINQFINQ